MTTRHSRLPADVAEAFAFQAKACRELASPFTAAVCEALVRELDEKSAFGRRIFAWGAARQGRRAGAARGQRAAFPRAVGTGAELAASQKNMRDAL